MAQQSSLDSPQILEHLAASLTFTPFETLWVPRSAKLVVLGETPRRNGAISFYELDVTANKLKLNHTYTKNSGFKCGTFDISSKNQQLLATGDFAGNLCIWDVEKMDKPIYEVEAHTDCINAVSGCGGGVDNCGAPELATCSRDGTVKVWDPRVKKAVCEIEAADKSQSRDCWTVTFGNSFDNTNRCIASGYDNGDVKILDLKTNKMFWETNVKNGVVCLEFDRKYIEMNKLLCTTLESSYRVFDCRTKHNTEGFAYSIQNAHKSTIWEGRHLPQNRDIWCTCGGNGAVNVWKYTYPDKRSEKDAKGNERGVMGEIELLADKVVAQQPIVSWNWNRDKLGLACCTALDQTVKVVIVTKLDRF